MGQKLEDIPNYKERERVIDGKTFVERKPNLVVHSECVEIYRMAIQNQVMPPKNRIGNWAQPFKDYEDLSRFVEAQFKDVERIKALIDGR